MKNFYANKKVLVTGGAGFIGSHLCEALIKYGAHVRILDNLSTGSIENIKHILPSIEFFQESLSSLDACIAATKGNEIIFHLAAEVSVVHSQKEPYACLKTNVQGTAHILESARINGCRRLILASSAAVYGDYQGICSEDLLPNPVSPYGYSKLLAEQLCKLYATSYGLETVALRYFNVYGPRQNPSAGTGGVISVLTDKITKHEPIAIFGDGQQTRDFISVDDIVIATLQAGTLKGSHTQGQAFNIATGKSMRLQDKLTEILKEFPTYQQPITYLPERPGDIKHSQADCSKFKKALEL